GSPSYCTCILCCLCRSDYLQNKDPQKVYDIWHSNKGGACENNRCLARKAAAVIIL
ncbi:hypothetical protein V5799_008206, partial [Amblyomma americanum]